MPRQRRLTPDVVIPALIEAYGIVTVAARSLGVNPNSIHEAINLYPEIKAAVQAGREHLIDKAEGALSKKIGEGDTAAIIFALKTIGRQRGYSERMTIDADTTIRVIYDDGTDNT
jgi:hypothetical protein